MTFTEEALSIEKAAVSDKSFDPLAIARARLEAETMKDPSLVLLITQYKESLSLGGENDQWEARKTLDAALKAIKQHEGKPAYIHTDRIDMLRVVQDEALTEKRGGIARTLVKQVAQRHEGR